MASIHHWIPPILNVKAWNIHTLLSSGELNHDTHMLYQRLAPVPGTRPVPETHTGTRDPRLHQNLKLVPKTDSFEVQCTIYQAHIFNRYKETWKHVNW